MYTPPPITTSVKVGGVCPAKDTILVHPVPDSVYPFESYIHNHYDLGCLLSLARANWLFCLCPHHLVEL
jgi:hypothetical protein